MTLKNTFLFLLLTVLFPLSGCAGLNQPKENPRITIKGKKEILVAQDIGRGDDVFLPHWCGNSALLYSGDTIGVEVIDLVTHKRVQISKDRDDTPFSCTPDGKWVLYTDRSIIRTTKGDMTFNEYVKETQLRGYARYLYRYEVATGKRERIATIGNDEGGWYEALSPDGSKVLLGHRWFLGADMTPPELEAVWFTNDWVKYGAVWFPDSSGVITFYNDPPRPICVEFFGKDGWAKCFEVDIKSGEDFFSFMLDKKNRLYFHVGDGSYDSEGIYSIRRCEIKDREFHCEEVLKRKGRFLTYAFLPDGDLIYRSNYGDECIKRATPWQGEGQCVVGKRFNGKEYHHASLIGASPDGRWLVFERSNLVERPDGTRLYWKTNLFVIELKNN